MMTFRGHGTLKKQKIVQKLREIAKKTGRIFVEGIGIRRMPVSILKMGQIRKTLLCILNGI